MIRCRIICYGVLIFLSKGYPPDKGRLHTCSAPVRRSLCPEGQIPLGLHVLGLPLAFILSQDQTLHCMFVRPYTQTQSKIDALVFLIWLLYVMSMNCVLFASSGFLICHC